LSSKSASSIQANEGQAFEPKFQANRRQDFRHQSAQGLANFLYVKPTPAALPGSFPFLSFLIPGHSLQFLFTLFYCSS